MVKEIRISIAGIIQMIWKELRIYIKLEWLKWRAEINEGRKSMDEAVSMMSRQFGSLDMIYAIMEGQVEIAMLALDEGTTGKNKAIG